MKFLLLTLLSLSGLAHASLPELFGPSAGSIAIGNQAQKESAANNYLAPSLLGYSNTTQFSFDVFYIATAFKDIDNVVIKNETNTVNQNETGSVDVNPSPSTLFAIHFSTPLFAAEGPKFNFSLFAPADRMMEADTGDPYQPQYVMYSNRYLRPSMIFSLAQAWGDWSAALGAHTGFQTNGETYFVTRTTNGTHSVAKMSFNAKPSIGAVVSVSKKWDSQVTTLGFQQEMKSNFENRATGETEVASNASFQFDFDLQALLYYDPITLKLNHQIHMSQSNLFFTLEYQQWENFDSSTVKLKKRGGTVNGSKNFEELELKNIFIPKIGYEHKLGQKWTGKLGYFYRQSPLDIDNLKNAGNSIDVDKHVGSLGAARIFDIYGKAVNLDLVYQAHLLRTQKIKKTSNLEDDQTAGSKIGSPGYTVGGMIHVVSLGLSWKY